MKINHRQNGFTLIEGLLTLIAISLIIFIGFYVQNASNKTDSRQSSSQINEKTAKPTDKTANWTAYTSTEGKFSVRYPNSWVTADNLEDCGGNLLLIGSTISTVGKCGTESSRGISFSGYPAPETESASEFTSEYYDDITSKNVTIDGVKGRRQSGTYAYTGEGIGSQIGTKIVLYSFLTDDITYSASYEQNPGDPDVTEEFDLIVTKTLKFN